MAKMFISYFLKNSTLSWTILSIHYVLISLVLEDPEIKPKAEALFESMKAIESNSGRGKIEGGKKALKIVVVGDGAVGLFNDIFIIRY